MIVVEKVQMTNSSNKGYVNNQVLLRNGLIVLLTSLCVIKSIKFPIFMLNIVINCKRYTTKNLLKMLKHLL